MVNRAISGGSGLCSTHGRKTDFPRRRRNRFRCCEHTRPQSSHIIPQFSVFVYRNICFWEKNLPEAADRKNPRNCHGDHCGPVSSSAHGALFYDLARSACTSASHASADASEGILQSPRGERATEPTFGPSGRQERLNCWAKKRRRKTSSQCRRTSSV